MVSLVAIVFFDHLTPPALLQEIREKNTVESFWMEKTFPHQKYSMVIVGDSRGYRGISPQAMEEVLKDFKIHNFSYSSGGLSSNLINHVLHYLDKKAEKKVVVLAVTPHSLTREASKNAHFFENLKKGPENIFDKYITHFFKNYFYAYKFDEALKLLGGKKVKVKNIDYQQKYFDDGWVASSKRQPTLEAISIYRDIYIRYQVDPKVVSSLMATVKKMINKGIEVIAFRVPTSREMYQLEQEISGFDEAQFKELFKNAGGQWISLPAEGTTYDGSHLNESSAIEFSKKLAEKISKYQ